MAVKNGVSLPTSLTSRSSTQWSIKAWTDFSDADFEKWRLLLEEKTGIHLVPQQKAFLQAQLTIRLRELGDITLDEYASRLQDGIGGMVEWSTLTDRLVVKETSFFRHPENCEFIRNLIRQRVSEGKVGESFDIWSVGCSTGEEPYSLAMMANDCFEEASLSNCWGVTGTDISMPALAFARQGIYARRKLDSLPGDEKQRYFEPLPDGRYQVSKKLRSRVCFAHGNVVELKKLPQVKMDLISSHNMLIYFRRWRRRKILNSLVEHLKPGGVLIIGMGEIVDWEHPLVLPVHDDTVQAYQRIDKESVNSHG
jgi:chemotaxis protein methyltransferase CheR/type IV pilus assembly protein PilK